MFRLTEDEIEFFRENGYLIKRGLLDPELMARARESLWENPPGQLDRDDPATWIGPFRETSDDRDSLYSGFNWKYRRRGGEEWMIKLLAKNSSVWAIAEQLVGEGALQEPERVRGIYCMMPEGDLPEWPYRCHVDAHPFHLGVVGYIDDVDADGGGFNVWPGSHKDFYYTFHSQYGNDPDERHPVVRAEYDARQRMDCHGKAGDVVFWHHRIGHSAGHNRTRRIRQAILYDFRRKNLDDLLETPPQENMWQDWDGLR